MNTSQGRSAFKPHTPRTYRSKHQYMPQMYRGVLGPEAFPVIGCPEIEDYRDEEDEVVITEDNLEDDRDCRVLPSLGENCLGLEGVEEDEIIFSRFRLKIRRA